MTNVKVIFWALFLCFSTAQAAKNVILFIGDGMGQGIITATRVKHYKPEGIMNLDKFPYTAIAKTYSASSIVTDSAAAATALACGEKTVNEVLGQDASAVPHQKDGKSLECISDIARQKGKAVGLVTTTEITHATPAGFYAKVNHRAMALEIAKQLLVAPFDLYLGGGQKYFDVEAVKKNPSIELREVKSSLNAANDRPLVGSKKILGLFAKSHLSYELSRDSKSTEPSIHELTSYAIDTLSKHKKGFFLMVEGGRIDHALHENKTAEALYETRQFDQAIGAALEQLRKMGLMKDTLVLVTADHETGGLSINGYPPHGTDILNHPHTTYASGPNANKSPKGALIFPPAEYDHSAMHTGIDVSVFAAGKGAEDVHGTIENTDVFKIMKRHLK